MTKTMVDQIGSWSFLAGVILAIASGFTEMRTSIAIILAILGLIIGLLNITDKEIKPFLYSGAIIVIVSSLGQDATGLIPWMGQILVAMMLIFVPATIIVALKSVFHMANA